MKFILTAAELHSLAKDSAHYAHKYLWSDGAETWSIQQLDWYVDDEARYGMGADSTLELEAIDLSDEGRRDFIRGFADAAPDGYNLKADLCSNMPWCAPWFWLVKPDWFDALYTAQGMGERFVAYCLVVHPESFREACGVES